METYEDEVLRIIKTSMNASREEEKLTRRTSMLARIQLR